MSQFLGNRCYAVRRVETLSLEGEDAERPPDEETRHRAKPLCLGRANPRLRGPGEGFCLRPEDVQPKAPKRVEFIPSPHYFLACVTAFSKFLLPSLACLLLAAALVYAAAPAKRGGPPLGTTAPDFSLLDVHGKQFRLADYRGKTVVLNFWAFWCDTWKAELPSLKELASQQHDMNFSLLAASVDGTRLPEFQHRTAGIVPFPVLMDVGGQVTAHYHVRHVPTVVIIGPDGTVRFTADGYPGNFVILHELRKIEK